MNLCRCRGLARVSKNGKFEERHRYMTPVLSWYRSEIYILQHGGVSVVIRSSRLRLRITSLVLGNHRMNSVETG